MQACAQVSAGGAPVIEGGIGYSYVRANVPSQGDIAMNGLVASASGDFNVHFGARLEAGYSRAFDAFQTGRAADVLTYMGGPVIYPIRRHRFSIYAEVLAGGARETGVNFESDGTLIRGYVNHFAWAVGGGAQFQVAPGLSMRVGADDFRTSFFNYNVAIQGQSNLRTSVSAVYTFGQRR
jgi:hypothetical protein